MATTYAAVTLTITATTLASAAARESASVNTDVAQNVNDYRIYVKPTAAIGAPAGSKAAPRPEPPSAAPARRPTAR